MKLTTLHSFMNDLLSFKLLSGLFSTTRAKIIVILVGSVGIWFWQGAAYQKAKEGEKIYAAHARTKTTGFAHHYAYKFVYFYHHKGWFPVVTTIEELEDSKEGAEALLSNHGHSLGMEYRHWSRMGENARIFLFLPHLWSGGSAVEPSILPFNRIAFTLALILCFAGLVWGGQTVFGLLLVGVFGSSPFLLHEVYYNENVFWLPAACLLALFGLVFPALVVKQKWGYYVLMALFGGIMLGTAIHIRTELKVVVLSGIVLLVFLKDIRWYVRVGVIMLTLLSYQAMSDTWLRYFEHKFEEAYTAVEGAGGVPYDGPKIGGHNVWHSCFVGLGDFDDKYGYEWNDRVAYAYGVEKLREDYDMEFKWSGELALDEWYDDEKRYYKKLELVPEYLEVCKEKVLSDISSDPSWYMGIVGKRTKRIATELSPVTLFGLNLSHLMPWFVHILILLVLLYFRKWSILALALGAMPLFAIALLIFSGGNTQFLGCYYFVTSAFLLGLVAELVLVFGNKLYSRYFAGN